ncbi:3299_t:CDS:2, partial [Ambispora gerdemannii]
MIDTNHQKGNYYIITDHLRTAIFALADGAAFEPKGRGYILKKLVKKATLLGHLLNLNNEHLQKISKEYKAEKDRLKKEENDIYRARLDEIEKEIVKIEEEKDYVIKDYSDLQAAAGTVGSLRTSPTTTPTGSAQNIYPIKETKKVNLSDNLIEITINADFNAKIDKATSQFTPAEITDLKTTFATLQNDYFKDMVEEPSSNKGDDRIFFMFGHELDYTRDTDGKVNPKSYQTKLFAMNDFFKFIEKVGPMHNLTFIESLDDSGIKKNFDFGILPADGEPYTNADLTMFGGLEKFYMPTEDFTLVERKKLNSLKDWFTLFWDAYTEPDNRLKSIAPFTYERTRPDGNGTEVVYCIDDINETIRERKTREIQLKSMSQLKTEEIAEQNKLIIAHQRKIKDENDKMEVESGKIRNLMEAAAADKKTEIAAAAKQMLVDIRYLKNDSNVNGPLERTDLASRIAKVKGGVDGISLEIVREAYAGMGDTAVVEAIDKEIKPKGQDDDKTKITEEELKEAFGNVTDVVDTNAIELVSDSSKKTDFIKYLKDTGVKGGSKIDEKAPEKVIKTIYAYWIKDADNKTKAKTDMKNQKTGTGDDEQRLDMTKYGATEKSGEPNDE